MTGIWRACKHCKLHFIVFPVFFCCCNPGLFISHSYEIILLRKAWKFKSHLLPRVEWTQSRVAPAVVTASRAESRAVQQCLQLCMQISHSYARRITALNSRKQVGFANIHYGTYFSFIEHWSGAGTINIEWNAIWSCARWTAGNSRIIWNITYNAELSG